MGDLERLWDDLPTGRPPISKMIAAGSRGPRRPRLLPSAGVAIGLVGAFAAGIIIAQPSGPGGSPGSPAGPTPVAFHGALESAGDCGALLDYLQQRGLEQVTAWGWSPEDPYYYLDGAATTRDRSELAVPTAPMDAAKAPAPSTATSSDTGTNVQEAGVDEPDHVKTDGDLLVRISGGELTTYDVSGPRVRRLGSLDLPGLSDGEILLSGDTVVALGGGAASDRTADYGEPERDTRVLSIDVSDPAEPVLEHTVDYTAGFVAVRQHDDAIRLVTSAGLPALDFTEPRGGSTQQKALDANRDAVRASTIDDWLPTVAVDDGSPEQVVDCADMAIPRSDLPLDVTSVVGFSADDPGGLDSALGIAGAASTTYESADRLYLATGGGFADPCMTCDIALPRSSVGSGSGSSGTTQLFSFAVDGTGATYQGSGEVEGSVRDRWSLDEYDGMLRVAVGATSETGDFSSIVTLAERDGDLVEAGRLDRLGVGEEIKAMRWFDALAIVVTYREVDPLYAIDLSDQSNPRLEGALKVPGFSSYLHPLGRHTIIGVGEGPIGRGWGAQLGAFNVTDVTDPRRIDTLSYGTGTEARAGADPRQFTWLPASRTLLTVVADYHARTTVGYVSIVHLAGGRMHNRMVRAEYGDDVDDIRTVPLPDGRVVLVTGEDARFLPLG